MIKMALYLSIIIASVACNPPQRLRQDQFNQSQESSTSNSTNDTSNTDTTNSFTDSGSSSSNSSSLPSGFESCDTTNLSYKASLGYIGVCQNSGNELNMRLSFSISDTSVGTCVIPTYKNCSGSSAYLGSAQCTKHNSGEVKYGTLMKNRNGYTHLPVNGVMIMKYTALDAYFNCMNAYDNRYSACISTGQYSASYCQQEANNYMTNQCNSFISNYEYIDKRLKSTTGC